MNTLLEKFNQLDDLNKKKVEQLMDLLLAESKIERQTQIADYKSKIADVSVWSEEDIHQLQHDLKNLGQWKIQEW